MKLSRRLASLNSEAALMVLAQAQALEAKGKDIIHLEVGEPDFPTPENICQAATKALAKGSTRYCNSQGIAPLREAVVKEFKKTYQIDVSPDRVVVMPGAKPVIFYSTLATLEEGDEAIYPDPGFPIYSSMIKFCGAKAVPLPLREELKFRFDIDEFRSLITPRTRMLIINNPQNPTGGILTEPEVKEIAKICLEHDITVLSDEIYDHIVYEEKPYSIAKIPGMLDRTIILNGFSKTYAMTGWRMGYAIMPQPLVEPVVRLLINSISCTVPFIQYAGIEALASPDDALNRMIAEFRKRRDLFVDGLNQIPGIHCHRPLGAFYVFPNIKKTGMTSKELAKYLLNEAGVAILAGSDFGACGEGYLRMSYANSQENIRRALDRIGKALAKVKISGD